MQIILKYSCRLHELYLCQHNNIVVFLELSEECWPPLILRHISKLRDVIINNAWCRTLDRARLIHSLWHANVVWIVICLWQNNSFRYELFESKICTFRINRKLWEIIMRLQQTSEICTFVDMLFSNSTWKCKTSWYVIIHIQVLPNNLWYWVCDMLSDAHHGLLTSFVWFTNN